MNTIRNYILGGEKSQVVGNTEILTRAQLKKTLREYGYEHLSEVERDVLETVATFKELHIIVDTYVSNNGIEHALVCLDGTIPVNYKGNLYHIPVCFWLSQQHPNLAPLVQVKPTQTMSIKVGNNIDDAGMVTMPYLDEWNKDKSDLASLIQILCIAFGETTPVYSRPALTTTKEAQVPGRSSPRQDERASPGNQDLASPRRQDRCSPVGVEEPDDYENLPMPRTYSFKKERKESVNLPKDEVKSRRAALLLQVDSMLTKSRIMFRQAEAMINVLENSKSELIKGPVNGERLDNLELETEQTGDWLKNLDTRFEEQNIMTATICDQVEDIKVQLATTSSRTTWIDKSYKDWSNEDVCDWFHSIGMGEFVPSVKEHRIKGTHLPNLSKDDLIELGVHKLGERLTIDEEISKLCSLASNII
eukprot:Seg1279.9 transcript_id=Seg1279.9/GoldUCD/mRNA.D3Y31 product="Tumor susceptibility gene 101 protein" protein_id=Seg1279.9/GoldUCD/D3Y31